MLKALGHEKSFRWTSTTRAGGGEEGRCRSDADSRDPEAAKKLQQIRRRAFVRRSGSGRWADTASLALGALRKGGKLIVVGLYGGEIRYRWCWSCNALWRIQGFQVGNVAGAEEVIALARTGKIKADPDRKAAAVEVSRTLDQLKAGQITGPRGRRDRMTGGIDAGAGLMV